MNMKKLLAAMILVVIAFTACNKDDDQGEYTPQKPAAIFAGKLLKTLDGQIYKYDELGRCTQIEISSENSVKINYDKSMISIEGNPMSVEFNKQGYIKAFSVDINEEDVQATMTGTFNYDKTGRLSVATLTLNSVAKKDGKELVENFVAENIYTWENNNLKSCKNRAQKVSDGKTVSENGPSYSFTYGDVPNKAGQNIYAHSICTNGLYPALDLLGQIGLLGKASAHFPTKFIITGDQIKPGEAELRYELNEDGTIKTEFIDEREYEYTYTTIGGE